MKVLKLFGHLLIIFFLTALTQVGGVIWLITLGISHWKGWKKRYIFPISYLTFNLILIPPLATCFGRVQLPLLSSKLAPRNWFYPLAFRNYADPELKKLLLKSSNNSGIKITYLDANFPFFNGFPLLPHLSHNDGKKIDLSFMYLDENGQPTNRKPSNSGYGIYVNEDGRTKHQCISQGHWQYDFTKYLPFGTDNSLKFDNVKTSQLLNQLLLNPETEKIFIEPYLKNSLGLETNSKVRFHGCKAVRHDDHIHLQIK